MADRPCWYLWRKWVSLSLPCSGFFCLASESQSERLSASFQHLLPWWYWRRVRTHNDPGTGVSGHLGRGREHLKDCPSAWRGRTPADELNSDVGRSARERASGIVPCASHIGCGPASASLRSAAVNTYNERYICPQTLHACRQTRQFLCRSARVRPLAIASLPHHCRPRSGFRSTAPPSHHTCRRSDRGRRGIPCEDGAHTQCPG